MIQVWTRTIAWLYHIYLRLHWGRHHCSYIWQRIVQQYEWSLKYLDVIWHPRRFFPSLERWQKIYRHDKSHSSQPLGLASFKPSAKPTVSPLPAPNDPSLGTCVQADKFYGFISASTDLLGWMAEIAQCINRAGLTGNTACPKFVPW